MINIMIDVYESNNGDEDDDDDDDDDCDDDDCDDDDDEEGSDGVNSWCIRNHIRPHLCHT